MDKKTKSLKLRSEINNSYKWKVEDIYSSDKLWEKDYLEAKKLVKQITKYKGELGKQSNNLLECLKLSNQIELICENLFVYARMRRDEDNTNNVYQALFNRAMSLVTEVNASISFITPEIISIPESKIINFIQAEKGLSVYQHYFDDLLRTKKHTLSEKEEEILALAREMGNAPADIFTMFNNADIKFPTICNENKEKVELTKGNYSSFLESKDRTVRKSAYKSLFNTYGNYKNTLATSLINNIKKNKFYATTRKYKSCLEASIDNDNISTEVYNSLIETVHKNLPTLHRYLKLRKKVLRINKLHIYDLAVPIIDLPEKKYKYEESLEIVQKGLKPLGNDYLIYLKNAFNSGWIDVFENIGKTSGAYSWGTYSSHPYVLLNYQGTTRDILVLAHEMGHALHSFYTNKQQPFIYANYKVLVAEVASTVNESLLMDYMIKETNDKFEKAYILNQYLEEFRGTVFRQTMLAEFEKIIHEKVESGESLTADSLCEIYYDLNKLYYGNDIVIDNETAMDWARIPHFYDSFYVYKYATGFSAAVSITNQILTEGDSAVSRYVNFLKSGNSDYPLELLKIAGVDLTKPEPVQDALNVFEKTLLDLERLI